MAVDNSADVAVNEREREKEGYEREVSEDYESTDEQQELEHNEVINSEAINPDGRPARERRKPQLFGNPTPSDQRKKCEPRKNKKS